MIGLFSFSFYFSLCTFLGHIYDGNNFIFTVYRLFIQCIRLFIYLGTLL